MDLIISFLNTEEVRHLLLFAIVLIVPKLLLRYSIPAGLTALGLGIFTSLATDWFQDDNLLLMLSRLGITSLFLFAGMEVDTEDLKKNAPALSKHLTKSVVVIFFGAVICNQFLGLSFRPSLILALGLLTPSTGFILNSLKSSNFSAHEEYWIRTKAIAKEIVAIALLFLALQSQTWQQLLSSTAIILAMILALPAIFRFFLKRVAPFAPDSEVAFLVLIALVCGVITMKIGAYYLVGAFIVGITAGRFKHFMESDASANTLQSLASFFTVFIPFYFYKAGLGFSKDLFVMDGFLLGLIFLLVCIPIRLLSVFSTMHFFLKDFWEDRWAIAMNLLPTLIFGLVVAGILKSEFQADHYIISALVIYTVVASIIPTFFNKKNSQRRLDPTHP